jgi:hypothetical protein
MRFGAGGVRVVPVAPSDLSARMLSLAHQLQRLLRTSSGHGLWINTVLPEAPDGPSHQVIRRGPGG